MTTRDTSDIHVAATHVLPTPRALLEFIPKTEEQRTFITRSREEIKRIIFGDDSRLLVVAGPCSIHDTKAGLDYARRFAALARELSDRMLLVMRVYFEKPRTTVGWKGLIMDPHLDSTYDIPEGLAQARLFLREVIDLGVPTATELLDPITPQYIADLICWSAIGARTTESQTHRQMASGLSMPLGFKNGTDGSVQVAINAIKAASKEQTFLGISQEGQASAVSTRGNPHCHIVLRGGSSGPNYNADHVRDTRQALEKNGLRAAIMIDCNHENSGKDPEKQPAILEDVTRQILAGDPSLIGVMIESNLQGGSQDFPQPISNLRYGVSITDGCLGWEATETALRQAHKNLAAHFANT